MDLREKVANHQVVAIVDNGFGDAGKGKIVHALAHGFDLVVRGTGGANAGHTIYEKGTRYAFHLLPSGILNDGTGQINVIGKGVAFDPRAACEELDLLAQSGIVVRDLKIAYNAHLVLPQHVVMDRVRESSAGAQRIGTTGRGIGPAYTDHYARVGLIVNDMLNPDTLQRKLKRNLADKVRLLEQADPEVVRQVLHHADLGSGQFYHRQGIFDTDAMVASLVDYGRSLEQFICDTDSLIRRAFSDKKRILLEGAQGLLLSIDHGTYPYVTSSDCSIEGLCRGAGLRPHQVDLTIGVAKAFYITRVGEGPFPTELGGEKSAEWCNSAGATRVTEHKMYGEVSVNDPDPFRQGVAMRQAGEEYGSTTGRPRRIGWFDLPQLLCAMQINGPHLLLTKLDVLDECQTIKVCVAYEYRGPPYRLGESTLQAGDQLSVARVEQEVLRHCVPRYLEFPGWMTRTRDIRSFADLPPQLSCLLFVEQQTGGEIIGISVGPGPTEMIVKE